MRVIQLKQWKHGRTIVREMMARGAKPLVAQQVAANAGRWWRNSGKVLNAILTIRWADQLGMLELV
ncbi:MULTISPECIES: RNA-directed DNA polymerase [unclassified Rhizobium]|uniref:RNA-directed DNA polymerase n=1 Tax=unclassified Rhizobium TaxID=2613769 RepID=UPI001FD9D644|nr:MULTISPECIES: RNA-directed DNA polymerase [unclassified Rhizobium]